MADNFTVTRIPQLAELLQKDGTLYLPVYKQDDDKTYRILVDLLGGATDTTLQWSSSETYNTGEIREWNLKLWKSKIDNNIGNVPSENANWTEVSKSEGSNSINYWNAGVYTINPTLTLYDNNLYLLDASQVSMPFESTDFLAEKTAGIWLQLTGSGGLASTWEDSITAIRAITDYSDGIDVGNFETGIIYEFDAVSTDADDGVDILKPDNIASGDPGRWVNKIDFKQFTASFSFTGIESFKQVFGKDLQIDSATIAPDISDLRVGKNGATPATITFPYTIAAADIIEFAATYDRESDSYFTLIGKEV